MNDVNDELEDDSLFDRYGLEPHAGPKEITERFRELVLEAPEAERDALRAAWDRLTLHPEERLRAAFLAHPETRPPLGEPPRRRRARVGAGGEPEPRASWLGLLILPSLTTLLGGGDGLRLPSRLSRLSRLSRAAPTSAAWLALDPVLAEKK